MSPTALELGCGSQGPDRGISGGNKSKILEAGKRAVEELCRIVWELRDSGRCGGAYRRSFGPPLFF